MSKTKKLEPSFYQRDTIQVARDLLGCHLVRITNSGYIFSGIIVETEAYLGRYDSCCHSYKGRLTERTKVMYEPGGCAYVYFTYGMHHCFNVITNIKGEPEAVLIRALEPIQGISKMQKNRNQQDIKNLTSGPGKLCQAFEMDRNLSGYNLSGNKISIKEGNPVPSDQIVISERIGLSTTMDACYWPLRFYIQNNPHISKK